MRSKSNVCRHISTEDFSCEVRMLEYGRIPGDYQETRYRGINMTPVGTVLDFTGIDSNNWSSTLSQDKLVK